MMKKIYTLALSLFVVASSFAQMTITHERNALRAGDVRNLKQIEYQAPGQGGINQVWDFSQSKELKDMTISQMENRAIEAITANNNLNLVCDEGGRKNTLFEITRSQKRYWGLENANVKIRFNEPIVDLKFPFSYAEKIGGIMDGTYTEINSGRVNSIKGTYTTHADAWGKLMLPDGNVYEDVLRIRVEKTYVQPFQINGRDEEYKISSIRYQYFAKGVRYPVLIILETEIKSDCNCACNSRTREAYYEPPVYFTNEAISENEEAIENFEYSVAPNPFENDLRISFSLSKNAKMEISLVDMRGKVVKKIINQRLEKGDYIYNVNTSDVIAGNYVLQVKVGKNVYSNKLIKK
jgi:hypothetical protein